MTEEAVAAAGVELPAGDAAAVEACVAVETAAVGLAMEPATAINAVRRVTSPENVPREAEISALIVKKRDTSHVNARNRGQADVVAVVAAEVADFLMAVNAVVTMVRATNAAKPDTQNATALRCRR